jgi:hypothetical protein
LQLRLQVQEQVQVLGVAPQTRLWGLGLQRRLLGLWLNLWLHLAR